MRNLLLARDIGMQSLVLKDRVTVSQAVTLVACTGLAVGLEMVFAAHLRLPGHRAFPGAFCLLLLSQVLAPMALGLAAAAIPVILASLGLATFATPVYWLAVCGVIVLVSRKDAGQSIYAFFFLGLLFGLARFSVLSFGLHKTPQMIRLAGHLAFGATGGLGAFAAATLSRRFGR